MRPVPVGLRVRTRREFAGVPAWTEGVVVEDYGTGFMIAWDLPERPLDGMRPEDVGRMFAVDPRCPLRDGFDKRTDAAYLDVVPGVGGWMPWREYAVQRLDADPSGFDPGFGQP